MKDYLAMRTESKGDKKDHGIKGQRWGITRSQEAIKSAIAKRAAKGEPVTDTKKAAAVLGAKKTAESPSPDSDSASKPAGSDETSQARYSRLQAQAKAGKAKEMSDVDLKFFNARTEALSKVAKLNKTDPNWAKEAVKTVAKTALQRQLQGVADAVGDKYVTGKVKGKLNPPDDKK